MYYVNKVNNTLLHLNYILSLNAEINQTVLVHSIWKPLIKQDQYVNGDGVVTISTDIL